MEQNFNLINQTSFEHDSFLKLQEFCTDLILKSGFYFNSGKIFGFSFSIGILSDYRVQINPIGLNFFGLIGSYINWFEKLTNIN